MPTVADVLTALESIAPARLALPGDRTGLQIGDRNAPVRRGFVSLDRSRLAARRAIEERADVWVCHHPLIWEPLTAVLADDHAGGVASDLIRAGVSFVAAHTNWDAAPGGVNDTLASLLELRNVESFGEASPQPLLKLVTFCPKEAAQAVLDALSEAGAGRIGRYSRCAFLSEGSGTFRPEAGSNPRIGSVGKVENVPEERIETVLPAHLRGTAIAALLAAHPYEEPAYDLYPLAGSPEQPLGRVGDLVEPLSFDAFPSFIDERLGCRSLAWRSGDGSVRRVAVFSGSGDSAWSDAKAVGAQVLLTGEVKQQTAVEATDMGISMVAAGHYATEQPGCVALRAGLAETLPEVEWLLYEPAPGDAGRPI